MSLTVPKLDRWFLTNWFVPVAFLVIVADVIAVYFGGWSQPRILELALLFDIAVLLPALYWWCYRKKGKATILKTVALACFSIWVMGKVLPPEHRQIIDSVTWIRYVGLAGLFVLEIKIMISVYKAVIVSGESRNDAQAKLETEGMPAWVARLMAFEASLWRRAWLYLKRIFGGR